MKIGILGTGDVGRTLANGFLATGHQVMLGSREPANEKSLAWAKEAGARSAASTGTFADAAKFAEVVVLAVSWSGAEHALQLAGAENLAGKVVIDAINPLTMGPRGLELAIGHTDSASEQVQRWLPGGECRQGVQQCWRRANVQAGFSGWAARHVHLRQGRRCEEDGH